MPYVRKIHTEDLRRKRERKKKNSPKKSPPTSTPRCDQNYSGLPFCLRWRLFPATGAKAFSLAPPKKRIGIFGWFSNTQGNGGFCSLYIEDALPSTSRCTCRPNNVHTYQTHTHIHTLNLRSKEISTVTCLFSLLPSRRICLSQIQCSTSRLAASCCVTSGGTGTSSMHASEAPVTILPCHMEWAAHARVADASRRAPPVGDR